MVNRICVAIPAVCTLGALLCLAGVTARLLGVGRVAGLAIPSGAALCSWACAFAGVSVAAAMVQLACWMADRR